MKAKRRTILLLFILGGFTLAQNLPSTSEVATWETWLVDADEIATLLEVPSNTMRETDIQELIVLSGQRDELALEQIFYWNTASPSYRWLEILNDVYKNGPPNPLAGRAFALMNIAIYDAVIASWKVKEDVGAELAPLSEFSESLLPLLPESASVSFPSEHAAVATVASEVLAYLQPDLADDFRAMAEEAINTRLLAGANVRSDLEAGKVIGQAVAQEIIAWAEQDGSATPWEYTRPEDSLFAVENPVFPMTGSWQTWVLTDGQQFRVPEPPAYDSAQIMTELEEIKAAGTTMPEMQQATYWATFYSAYQIWYDFANKLLFEQRQADNAPLMALIYSALGVAQYDAVVGCFDSKYAYVYARPSHLDADVTPLIPVPPHPSYPSAHSCASSAMALVFAHFFPNARDEALDMAQAAGQSRIYGRIHYQIDNEAGLGLGENVAGVLIEKLNEMTN
ncbi:MAG: phosphatase PAP2 family protein [Deinococcota bacterium]